MLTKIKRVLNGERPLIDVIHYLVGNYRNFIISRNWYSLTAKPPLWNRIAVKFIREHIKEQIRFRIDVMDKECYEQGSCKICGCETVALQMASKSCDKPCYPPMVNKTTWERFKKGSVIKKGKDCWILMLLSKKLLYFRQTPLGYAKIFETPYNGNL